MAATGRFGYTVAHMKALIIEDDPGQAAYLDRGLYDCGYECDVAADGVQGFNRLRTGVYAFAIVDMMLPSMPGIEVVRRARLLRIATPIIVLSALGDVANKVAGLQAGADDYLAKPFSFDELEARIAAVVRRGNPDPVDRLLRHRDLVVDPRSRHVRRGDKRIFLTPHEYQLLEHLLRHRDRIFSSALIAETIWGLSSPPQSKAVETRIYSLRAKLRAGGGADIIENERGFGYVIRSET